MTEALLEDVQAQLDVLQNPKVREANLRRGDDHGVNLTALRTLAKKFKGQPGLVTELWGTGDVASRLLAILMAKPKDFSAQQLDSMLREAAAPKVHDWLVNYIVKKSPHVEDLRLRWRGDHDPVVESAGWALTSERVVKSSEGLDLPGLLDEIEARMGAAPERLQWAMNHTLAQIGIEHTALARYS
ncbi:DNA alkylation repair protein [Pseudarthrobacter sp. J1738]|uniref:DNA alkylation repair protein n=1 Tax=Pseudarthrobacter sp. J1738 TaxID=3420446 RepID=UPI003D293449